MSTVITIVVSIVIFGVLILSHEFGHFIVARKCGVTVEEFAMGMGPVVWEKQTQETTYSVRLFPIGGFCQMKGEDADDKEEGSFASLKPFKKILVLGAGSMMNFIVAILIFFIIICSRGNVATTTINTTIEDSPAYYAGLNPGDKIITVNGVKLEAWEDLSVLMGERNGEAVLFEVTDADGNEKTLTIVPYLDEETQTYKVGITPVIKTNIFLALWQAVQSVGLYISLIFKVFGQLFGGVIGMEAFSGPIGATVIIGQSISMGYLYVLNIAASISVSLGLFNLFPIPALDGSRILFAVIEWIKGSPVNPGWEGTLHFVGFILLMGFAVFIAYKDIVTFF